MHNNKTSEETNETANAIKPTNIQAATNVELSIEEEEQILAMTDDIEIFDNDQPVSEQDNKGKQIVKKLGLRGNSNKFHPPSSVGLLPTPSTPSFVRSAYNPPRSSLSLSPRPGPSGLTSHPPFASPTLSSIYAPDTPLSNTFSSQTNFSSAAPIPPSLLPCPQLFSTPALPGSPLPNRLVTPSTSAPILIERLPLPLPQTFVLDLSRHYCSLYYHQTKEAFFSRSINSGYYPSFTLPRFTSDLTKGLSHNLTVQYHEAIATLRNQICIIMRDHHRGLQQEEDARITALTNNLNGIYEPNIVRIIIDNAKRTASNKNRKGNRQ